MIDDEDKILLEAKERFKHAEEWESASRVSFVEDMKLYNADSNNLWQWPEDIAKDRQMNGRPCLTINRVRQHCLNIINDQRQHQSMIEIRPVGDGASSDAAKILEGIVRHIEYISNAQSAYTAATFSQVISGIGFWRVITDYRHDGSFDQEVFIKRVSDPLSVYLDPDIEEADGSDARYAFIFRDIPRDEYLLNYPEEDPDDIAGASAPLGTSDYGDAWDTDEYVRICEYYRKVDGQDTLHLLDNGMTVAQSTIASDSPDLLDQLHLSTIKTRQITAPQIEHYLIAGSRIIEKKMWPGKYIPIVRCIGEEVVIDKKLDRRGHARMLRDQQLSLNYYSSSAIEAIALQTKTPWVASSEAIMGYEEDWSLANIDTKGVLLYNSKDLNGQPLEKPDRVAPPQMPQAYLQGIQLAKDELMQASGQFEANMGIKSNEVSGAAVDARSRQGAVATQHFIDRFSQAIRFTGRILVDLIPKIYDTERVIKILAQDGSQTAVKVDPNAPNAHIQVQDPTQKNYNPQDVAVIFNPTIGLYEVESDIGPAYATKRQESFNALSQIMQHNPALMPIIGDLMFRSADFPLADEIAERMLNVANPQALGKAPDPQVMHLQQQLQQASQAMQHMQQQLQQAQLSASQAKQQAISAKSQPGADALQSQIDWYRAETDRLKAVGTIDPAAMMPVIRQMVSEVLNTPANPVIAQHLQEQSQMADPDAQPPEQVEALARAQAAAQPPQETGND